MIEPPPAFNKRVYRLPPPPPTTSYTTTQRPQGQRWRAGAGNPRGWWGGLQVSFLPPLVTSYRHPQPSRDPDVPGQQQLRQKRQPRQRQRQGYCITPPPHSLANAAATSIDVCVTFARLTGGSEDMQQGGLTAYVCAHSPSFVYCKQLKVGVIHTRQRSHDERDIVPIWQEHGLTR